MSTNSMVSFSREEQIKTRKAKSKARFDAIYKQTLQLCGITCKKAPCSKGVKKCWVDILEVWKKYSNTLGCEDVLFAALYHIQWRTFQPIIRSSELKKLVLLVEQELLDDGYAFDAWRITDDFKQAFDAIIGSVRLITGKRGKWHANTFRRYIYSRTFSLVMYKGKKPDNTWLYMTGRDIRSFTTAAELFECYTRFERILCCLLPEAANWDVEWAHESYIMQSLKAAYGIDFTLNYADFDRLVEAVGLIIDQRTYTRALLEVENFTFTIAEAIWGSEATKKIQCFFSTVYQNHKSWVNKKRIRNTNSAYSKKNIMDSWIYKMLNEWSASHDKRLTQKTKDKLFNFCLGI